MAEAHIKIVQTVKSGNFQEIPDNDGLFQNYDAICKLCPNFKGGLSKKCRVRWFEIYGY